MTNKYINIKRYQISSEWVLARGLTHHEVDHFVRVLVWVEYLSDLYSIEDREALRWAAVLHDIRRRDDGDDPGHGKRAAEWIVSNLQDRIGLKCIDEVCKLCEQHDIEVDNPSTELMILKDADALDRVRLGGVDTNRLYLPESKLLVGQAYKLYAMTKNIPIKEVFDFTIKTAIELGLLGSSVSEVCEFRARRFWVNEDEVVIRRAATLHL